MVIGDDEVLLDLGSRNWIPDVPHLALNSKVSVPLEMPVVLFLRDKGLGPSETSLLTSEVIERAIAVLVVTF